jgi:hypothetical protein
MLLLDRKLQFDCVAPLDFACYYLSSYGKATKPK